ncbi:hypothetical protein G6O69_21805 [Pseudenhygromyxa sp. WMMC2535]|uniref:hypothetical protein n=1 Tax=Pseudenhygromyxa sp. WMMC2535 TaxID=2712867 RepID=UPI0015563A4B|nr:hypothetical protein [Pseudenhygromyxa sp. WMMC2535]NVB40491.1 hypothetical protein [Pseudenhygromyxa sp. WMMC2535]
MRAPSLLLPCALLFVPLLACGPKGKVSVPEGADKTWAEMNEDERMAHMGAVVLPRMRAVFQAHDPERYASFGCATCHGHSGSFEMPNPELPELDASNFYKQERQEHGDMVKLMWKEVEPTMGEALGVTYSFGGTIECHSCHVVLNEDE